MFRNIIKYLPIVLCTIGFHPNICAQNIELNVIDSISKKPISNIHLYYKNELIGFTDFNGKFTTTFVKNTNNSKLYLSHIGYHEKEILFKSPLNKLDTVLLKPKTYLLDEVLISNNNKLSISNKNSFKAYFRGWQMENNNLKYFVDGICLYTLSKDFDIDRKILEYRFFKNDSLINNRNKRIVEIEIGFVLPKLTQRTRLERSLSMSSDSFIINKNKKTTVLDYPIILFGEQRGKYSLDSLSRLSSYEYNQQRNGSYTAKKLGYRQKILNEYYLIKYKLFNGVYFTSFEKKFSLKKIKHKKDKSFNNVETNFEIFIIGNGFLETSKKRIKIYSKKHSNYKNHYWNDYFIKYPLPKSLSEKIKKLNLTPNKYKSPK